MSKWWPVPLTSPSEIAQRQGMKANVVGMNEDQLSAKVQDAIEGLRVPAVLGHIAPTNLLRLKEILAELGYEIGVKKINPVS